MDMQRQRESVGLPYREFFYTVDQVADMLGYTEKSLHQQHLYHEGRDIGPCPPRLMKAINLAADGEKPEWRIPESQLVPWMKRSGMRIRHRYE